MQQNVAGVVDATMADYEKMLAFLAGNNNSEDEEEVPQMTIEEKEAVFRGKLSVEGFCDLIKDGSIKKIVVMCGAGISVSAGIPDFRSEGGLYEQVKEKYDMRARADWAALKPSTPFGQLPFMNIDGSAPIAQSGAMCVFHDLC